MQGIPQPGAVLLKDRLVEPKFFPHQLNLLWGITLEALSRQYQIPLTTMKACFKSVYGSPVNTYMRALRMDRAALLLRKEPEASVTEIAGAVGYDSSSKFAAAFRAAKGQTPLEYRRGGGNPVLSFPDETE